MAQTVRDVLVDLEKSLIARLSELRAQIIPLERELAEVRRARSAVTMMDYGPEQTQLVFTGKDGDGTSPPSTAAKSAFPASRSPYADLTIKQLVIKALTEQFERGATANELLEFFANGYGRREVMRTSLSPQLSRLKLDGEIVLIGQKWSLATAHTRPPPPVEKPTPKDKAAASH